MNRIHSAALALFGALLAAPALAQPALPTPGTAPVSSSAPASISSGAPVIQLPAIESLKYARGIEWGGRKDQMRLELIRQPDGTYLASVSGEKHAARSNVVLQEIDLVLVRLELHSMRNFPDDSFAGAGNHWYTDLQLVGNVGGNPYSFTRWFYESGTQLDFTAGRLERAVSILIDQIEARFTKKINPWTRTINTTAIRIRNRRTLTTVTGPGAIQPLTKGGTAPSANPALTPVTPATNPVVPAANPTVVPHPAANPGTPVVSGPAIPTTGATVQPMQPRLGAATVLTKRVP